MRKKFVKHGERVFPLRGLEAHQFFSEFYGLPGDLGHLILQLHLTHAFEDLLKKSLRIFGWRGSE
ncbi:hypothetical protein [Thermosulfurimonas sp. F29]|uniref:hypothetical protein n=1 Tax=Thermosulfurimonas sp. F29 TaxID=2867247 RepID=UPI001C834C5D|nr:hypothetical protein [Thermosulfurimonas sp. F29]MBX6422928.1 hypothetical protein [Thermosulfurimonas sp. F29]